MDPPPVLWFLKGGLANIKADRLVKYFEECSFKKDSKIVRADANLYVMKVTRDGWVAPFL